MKELNLGDTVYHIDHHTMIDTYQIVSKTTVECIYNSTYDRTLKYSAFNHPVTLNFSDRGEYLLAEDGSRVFSSKEEVLNYINQQLNK